MANDRSKNTDGKLNKHKDAVLTYQQFSHRGKPETVKNQVRKYAGSVGRKTEKRKENPWKPIKRQTKKTKRKNCEVARIQKKIENNSTIKIELYKFLETECQT